MTQEPVIVSRDFEGDAALLNSHPPPPIAGRITRYLQVVWPLVAMTQEPVIVTRDFESDAALTQRFPPNERRVFC